MVLLKDLVVIGQGAPNQLRDGRQSVCVCAYSLELKQLVRIYPVPIGWLRKWDMFDAEVENNPTDHRENTWKIKNSKADWKKLDKWISKKEKYPEDKHEELIKSIGFSVLSELIKNKKSFGIIKPIIKDFKLPTNLSDAKLYHQAGNSVTVPVIERIAVQMKKVLY